MFDRDAHNPDTNENWKPKMNNRWHVFPQCGCVRLLPTNHTGRTYGYCEKHFKSLGSLYICKAQEASKDEATAMAKLMLG